MDLTRSTVKLFSARVGNAVIAFIGITYFARELNPHAMGVFFLFEALLGMLSIGADFGIRGAIEKRISEGVQPSRFLTTGILLKILPLLLILLGLFTFDDIINEYVGAEISIYLALTIILHEFAELTLKVLNAELNVGKTAILQMTRQIFWVIVSIVLLQVGYGVFSLVYGYIAGLLVMFAWGVYRASTPLGRPGLNHAKSLFDYSKYNFVSFSLAGYFYSWIDIAIIGFFLTQSAVGAYEIAWRVTVITTLLSSAVATAIFPQMSQWSKNGERNKIERLITRSITPSLALVIPAAFGVFLVGREILQITFGPAYATAWGVLVILMIEKLFRSVHVIIGHTLQAIDRPDLAARAAIVAIGLNITLNLLLVPPFGITGAAVATATSFVVNTLLHTVYLSRFLTVRLPYQELGWCLIASVVMSGILVSVRPLINPSSLLELSLVIGIGATSYGIVLFASPSIRIRVNRYLFA